MTVKNFLQLCEMLNPKGVLLKMSYKTHKYILGIAYSDDTTGLSNQELPNALLGIAIQHDDKIQSFQIEFVAMFTPKIDDSFFIKLDEKN